MPEKYRFYRFALYSILHRKRPHKEQLPGQRRRGRPRLLWMDNIKAWARLTLEEALRKRMIVTNGEDSSLAQPTLGSRMARRTEQNRFALILTGFRGFCYMAKGLQHCLVSIAYCSFPLLFHSKTHLFNKSLPLRLLFPSKLPSKTRTVMQIF